MMQSAYSIIREEVLNSAEYNMVIKKIKCNTELYSELLGFFLANTTGPIDPSLHKQFKLFGITIENTMEPGWKYEVEHV